MHDREFEPAVSKIAELQLYFVASLLLQYILYPAKKLELSCYTSSLVRYLAHLLQKNAGVVLSGKTAALLFTLYRGATRHTQVQAVGARVIVRAVVTVHSWRPHNQVRGVAA